MTKDQKKLSKKIEKNGMENLYVHAGNSPATQQHDWVYLFVCIDEVDSVENYGEVLTIITNDIADKDLSNIATALWDDRENDELTPDLDSYLDGLERDDIDDLINPDDIVDSAGFWDLPSFVTWYSERFPESPGVKTNDGLAVVEVEAFCKQFCAVMTFDELFEVIEDIEG